MKMIEKIMRSMRDTGLMDGMSDEDCDTLATASLEAMREPTNDMVREGAKGYFGFASVGNRVCNGWRKMVDAALNE